MATSSKAARVGFSLTDPFFLAGKSGASCALALLIVDALSVPDLVTAAFVAILCCSPGALMGLRTSLEQLTGSALGGLFGTLAAVLALPLVAGVPLAVTFAILGTYAIGFSQGTVAAAFTALFVQIVTFGEPLHTFGYRLEAVGIAALSAFIVNVAVSAFFYRSLFRKRLRKVQGRVDELVALAAEQGPGVMHSVFAVLSQLDLELSQALRELSWRRNESTSEILRTMRADLVWLRDFVHLIVDLEMTARKSPDEVLSFMSWLRERKGEAPAVSGQAVTTRARILQILSEQPSGAHES